MLLKTDLSIIILKVSYGIIFCVKRFVPQDFLCDPTTHEHEQEKLGILTFVNAFNFFNNEVLREEGVRR